MLLAGAKVIPNQSFAVLTSVTGCRYKRSSSALRWQICPTRVADVECFRVGPRSCGQSARLLGRPPRCREGRSSPSLPSRPGWNQTDGGDDYLGVTTYKIITAIAFAVAVGLAAGCAPGEQGAAPAQSPASTNGPADASPTETAEASPTETADAVETIRVSVQDGEVSPPPDRVTVQKGQRVRIVVTSDQPDELHIHGYDESIELEPGEPATVEFTADQSGLYEVETHETNTLLFQLVVRG